MSDSLPNPFNEFGQPVGFPVPDWCPAAWPIHQRIMGRYCELHPISIEHTAELWDTLTEEKLGKNWTYLPDEPFRDKTAFETWVEGLAKSEDPQFYTILPRLHQRPAGIFSLMRIQPQAGSIEIGHIHFSESLKKTREATEALFLLMETSFELGYRRLEWKCDALNEPSRNAAHRLGFVYEGTFRNALVYKGRNRDTAWFSIIKEDWPRLKSEYLRWLDPSNFELDGKQRSKLSASNGL